MGSVTEDCYLLSVRKTISETVFIALYTMQGGISHSLSEMSLRVCLFVCQTHEL